MTLNTHANKLTFLKISVLGFGIFALPEVVIMLLQVVIFFQIFVLYDIFSSLNVSLLSTLQFFCFQIAFSGFLILAFGVYQFSSSRTDKIGKEGKQLSLLFVIFFVCLLIISTFGLFLSLKMGDTQMASTIADIDAAYSADRKYADWARIWAVLILIANLFLFIITLKFSAWINRAAKQYSTKGTMIMTSASGFYCLAALFVFVAISILFPIIKPTAVDLTPFHMAHRLNLDLTDKTIVTQLTLLQDAVEAQIISYYFLLLGFISQIVVSIKIFLKLHEMSSTEMKV